MSPAEKLDEIVRALEQADQELDPEWVESYLSRALTLARELRDNAVEGLLASGQTEE